MSLHYAIIGTGAIGGFVGAHLKNIGKQVSFLARSNFTALKQQLTIEKSQEVLELADLDLYNTIDRMPKCDVAILATKATSNKEIICRLAKLLTPDGVILVLQNGIGYEERIADYISEERIIGAAVLIKVSEIKPGYIKHYGLSRLTLAGYSKKTHHVSLSPLLREIANDFNEAGIETLTNENLAHVRWKKLVGNIPGSGLCVILNSNLKMLYDDPHGFALVKAIASEVVEVANHCGAEISLKNMMAAMQRVKEAKLEAYPSLKEDYDCGRELELEALYENPLAIAEQHGQEMPLTRMLYQQLCFLQQNRLRQNN